MQIAGSTCNVCDRKVVLSLDGKFCPHCGIVVHRACEAETNCRVCGRAFREDEHPSVDPAREAVLPRALRERNTGVGVALLIAGVAGLVVILCYVFMELW